MTKATDTPPVSLLAARARRPAPLVQTASATPSGRSKWQSKSWPSTTRQRLRRATVAWIAYLSTIALATFCPLTRAAPPVSAQSGQGALAFAVVTSLPTSERDGPQAQALLDWIGSRGKVAFIVHLGNIKGPDEPCSDTLFASRHALLDSAPVPLIFIPGQADWIDCALPRAGGAEPLERLDAIRESFLSGPTSLGMQTLRVSRQSELPAFRPYRENTRWMDAGIVFVTLDVPSDNNHFLDGGGRNGEYEDREIASRYWIARALTDAKRRQARALVFFFQGNPHFAHEGRETRPAFAWWFGKKGERDGYLALRRDLVAAARSFPGPVLLVHAGTSRSERGFSVEPMLHDRSGKDLRNMKRIEVEAPPHLTGWVRILASGGKSSELEPTFHAELEHAPLAISAAPAITGARPSGNFGGSATASMSDGLPGSPIAASDSTSQPAAGADDNATSGDEATGHVYPDDAYPEERSISGARSGTNGANGRNDPNTPPSSALGTITTPTLLPLPPLDQSSSPSAPAKH